MSTVADMISETEDHLLGGDRDVLNFLANSLNSTDTSFTLTMPLDAVSVGSYLAVDLEVMYVQSVDNTSSIPTVVRGMLGSTAATHAAGALVAVNPVFSKWQIWKALNTEITSLSGADNGLFAETAFTLTTQSVRRVYDVPVLNNDIRQILEIRYNSPGAENYWPVVPKRNFAIIRDVTTDAGDSSGLSIRIDDSFIPGRALAVRYAGDFLPLSSTLSTNVSTTNLGASMFDIPALGAAARLMGVREAKRTFIERSQDTRRAAEVPVGSSSRAAATLLSLLNGRIKSEAARLRQRWPDAF